MIQGEINQPIELIWIGV